MEVSREAGRVLNNYCNIKDVFQSALCKPWNQGVVDWISSVPGSLLGSGDITLQVVS